MLSKPSGTVIQLQPERSRILLAILVGGHAAALAMVPLCGVRERVTMLLMGLVLISLVRAIRIHWRRRGAAAIHRLTLTSSNEWKLLDGNGREFEAELVDCFIHPWLAIVNFRIRRGARRTVLLFPDSEHRDNVRKLRVRLGRML